MKSVIYVIKSSDGKIQLLGTYLCNTKKALVCFFEQRKKNFNTWSYPVKIEGMWESKMVKGLWYYEDNKTGNIYAAYPDK